MGVEMDGDVEVQVGPVKVKFTSKKPEETKGLGFTKDHLVVAHLKHLLYLFRDFSPPDSLRQNSFLLGMRDEAEVLEKLLQEMGLD